MARTAVSVVFLILTAFVTSGCATKALVEYAEEEEYRENVVAYATRAWRDETGELVVCAIGWTAKQGLDGEPYSFSFRLMLALPDTPTKDAGIAETVTNDPHGGSPYPVSIESIEESCPDRPDGALEVPVERIAVADSGEITESGEPLMSRPGSLDPDRAGPVLYSVDQPDEKQSAILVYLNETPLSEGSRLGRIYLPGETVQTHNLAFLAFPVALAIDVVIVVAVVAEAFSKIWPSR